MKKVFLVILAILCIVPLLDLFHPGLPITHDGKDHVARIANFYINLQDGNLIPRWAGLLNWGYGHPILEFLYPLPSYLASLFHFVGFSLIDATKIILGIGMFASAIAMYFWLMEFLPVPAAFVGGLLYMIAPYRFIDVYVRGDIGENLAFVFMPLTLLFMYRLSKHLKSTTIFLAAASFAGLMIAHNAIVLMYFPFILFYGIYLIYLAKNKKQLALSVFYVILLGFSLSAFFWVPALFEGKYTLRNIVTVGEYASRFSTFTQLLYGPWSYKGTGEFTVQLGIINWLMIIGSLLCGFIFWKKKSSHYILVGGLLLYTIGALFLMLPQSNFIWQKIMLLQNFQFPWRFLAVPIFTTAVLGALCISVIPQKFYTITVILVTVLILFFNKDYWHANGYLYKTDNFFTGIYDGTTDTGESSPIWSIRFMLTRFTKPMKIIDGTGNITPLKRTMTKHTYTLFAKTNVRVRENTVYFPGWEVLIDNIPTTIQYQDQQNRGLITFYVTKGTHNINVIYKETKLRLLADFISLLSMVFIIAVITTKYITRKSKK